jgi:hypothetical protein
VAALRLYGIQIAREPDPMPQLRLYGITVAREPDTTPALRLYGIQVAREPDTTISPPLSMFDKGLYYLGHPEVIINGVLGTLRGLFPADVPVAFPAPSGLIATAGNGQVSLQWIAPAGTPTGFRLYQDGVLVVSPLATSTALLRSGLINGQTYTLTLSAVYAGGESVPVPFGPVTPQAPSTPYNNDGFPDMNDGSNLGFEAFGLLASDLIPITTADFNGMAAVPGAVIGRLGTDTLPPIGYLLTDADPGVTGARKLVTRNGRQVMQYQPATASGVELNNVYIKCKTPPQVGVVTRPPDVASGESCKVLMIPSSGAPVRLNNCVLDGNGTDAVPQPAGQPNPGSLYYNKGGAYISPITLGPVITSGCIFTGTCDGIKASSGSHHDRIWVHSFARPYRYAQTSSTNVHDPAKFAHADGYQVLGGDGMSLTRFVIEDFTRDGNMGNSGMIVQAKDSAEPYAGPYSIKNLRIEDGVINGGQWGVALGELHDQPDGSHLYFENVVLRNIRFGPGIKNRTVRFGYGPISNRTYYRADNASAAVYVNPINSTLDGLAGITWNMSTNTWTSTGKIGSGLTSSTKRMVMTAGQPVYPYVYVDA